MVQIKFEWFTEPLMMSNPFLFENLDVFSRRLLNQLPSNKPKKLLNSQRDSEQESNQIQLENRKET